LVSLGLPGRAGEGKLKLEQAGVPAPGTPTTPNPKFAQIKRKQDRELQVQ
jgi:hypothetical protein